MKVSSRMTWFRNRSFYSSMLIYLFLGTITVIIMTRMDQKMKNTTELEGIISGAEIITLIALAITLLAGIVAYHYRSQLNDLRKIQDKQRALEIAEANSQAAKARADSEGARAVAEDAILKQKEIEEKNLLLQIELERLRKATRPRVLPEEMIPQAIQTLAKYKNKCLRISTLYGDSETDLFSKQIASLFQQSGWDVRGGRNIEINTQSFFGIKIASDKENEICADRIAKMFEDMEFHVSTSTMNEANDCIKIDVGQKEPPIIE